MLEIRIEDLNNNAFGSMRWFDNIDACMGKIKEAYMMINFASRLYEERMVSLITHELIHLILLRDLGESITKRFDLLFPTLHDSECLVDCDMRNHMLWRKQHNVLVMDWEL